MDHQRLHRSASINHGIPITVLYAGVSPVLIKVLQYLVKCTALQLSGIHASAPDYIIVACPIMSSSTSQVIIKFFHSHINLICSLLSIKLQLLVTWTKLPITRIFTEVPCCHNFKETIKTLLPKVTHAPASDLFQITSYST